MECLNDYIAEENPVRVLDVSVYELGLFKLGYEETRFSAPGRPSYLPAVSLKIHIYGYLNRVQSSRGLEHEAERSVELIWLTGQLAPDFKTIADNRRDEGNAIRSICREFVVLCSGFKSFSEGIVAIDRASFRRLTTATTTLTIGSCERECSSLRTASRAT